MARWEFSAEFKREAVRLAGQSGVTKSKVARELGIHLNVLRNWIKQFESGKWERSASVPLKNAQQAEIEQLRRELKRVITERDILKKAVGYFAKGSAVKYAFIKRHCPAWPVRMMCRLLEASPGGYYARWDGR